MTETVAIAGAGHAAGQVVATLKQKKFDGRVVLIGEEAHLPYQRPPLSKKYLAGELDAERLHFKPASFYAEPNIDVLLNTRVEKIVRGEQRLILGNGQTIDYDKLVLALGSRARRVPVDGELLKGVYYLRTLCDVNDIRSNMSAGKKVAIIGAGYIGLEVAAVCRQLGLQVTVIEMADRVMSRVVSPQVSAFYQQYHEQQGVIFRLSTSLESLQGDGHVTAVEVDGGEVIDADFVIIGAGIVPNCELAEDAGIEVENGIVVDDRCQTSDQRIFAVGDCTSHPNGIYGRRLRLESVHNALEQAKTAAGNICGGDHRYSQVPWFWSDQYDLKLQIAGLSEGYDQTVMRGDPGEQKFACLYLRDGVLIAVDAVNSPREFTQSKTLIAQRARIDSAVLADSDVDLIPRPQ